MPSQEVLQAGDAGVGECCCWGMAWTGRYGEEDVVAVGCCGREMSWKRDAMDRGMLLVGEWHGQENATEGGVKKGRCCGQEDARNWGMLRAGGCCGQGMVRGCHYRESLAGAAHGRYLWFPPSQQSHRQCWRAQHSAQVAGRSAPHACSEQLACGERGSGMWCQPGQQRGTMRPRTWLFTLPASASPAGTQRGRRQYG